MTNKQTKIDWLDNEIDLRQYIQSMLRWWKEIFFIAAVCVALTIGAMALQRLLSTPTYEASATVAIARIRSAISFDERFRTLADSQPSEHSAAINSRRAALVGLAYSGSIAESVLDQLAEIFADEASPATLLGAISAQTELASDGRTQSDLIRITARAETPEKAAVIANTWAQYYVLEVNQIYSQVPVEVLNSVKEELTQSQLTYDAAQGQLESFIADNEIRRLQRQINDKATLITTLQTESQEAVKNIIGERLNAESLIAFTYINAMAENRLIGFQKEQEAKRKILETYIDADIESRLEAIQQDREARLALFRLVSDAQLSSAKSVLTEQVQNRLSQLHQLYTISRNADLLLLQSRLLADQINTGGDSTSDSNEFSLTLLKAQLFTLPPVPQRRPNLKVEGEPPPNSVMFAEPAEAISEEGLLSVFTDPTPDAPVINIQEPNDRALVQLNADLSLVPSNRTVEEQAVDIRALISSIETYRAHLNEEIDTLALSMLNGTGYSSIELFSNSELAIGDTATTTGADTEASEATLAQTVHDRYADLFDVGELAKESASLAGDSELLKRIRTLYPQLFSAGTLTLIASESESDSELSSANIEKIAQMMRPEGLEALIESAGFSPEVEESVAKIETEILTLQAQLEAGNAHLQELTQKRDLARDTVNTLSSKKTELELDRSAADREVLLAAPAVLPIEPIPGLSVVISVGLAGIVGLMLGIIIALFGSYMDREPFLCRRPAAS